MGSSTTPNIGQGNGSRNSRSRGVAARDGLERPMGDETTAVPPDHALDRCVVFRALDEGSRRALIERSHRRRAAAGEVIFTVGAPGRSMMTILSGLVRISLPTSGGREMVLADLGPGEVLGEVALIDGRDRSATATALGDCDFLVLERAHFLPILQNRADVCLRLLELLCARLRRSDERMADIGFMDIPSRLAKMLVERSKPSDMPGESLRVSQTELAGMIGCSRENVNRHLRNWRRRGIITSGVGWVRILRRDQLAAIAGPD